MIIGDFLLSKKVAQQVQTFGYENFFKNWNNLLLNNVNELDQDLRAIDEKMRAFGYIQVDRSLKMYRNKCT